MYNMFCFVLVQIKPSGVAQHAQGPYLLAARTAAARRRGDGLAMVRTDCYALRRGEESITHGGPCPAGAGRIPSLWSLDGATGKGGWHHTGGPRYTGAVLPWPLGDDGHPVTAKGIVLGKSCHVKRPRESCQPKSTGQPHDSKREVTAAPVSLGEGLVTGGTFRLVVGYT